MGLAYLAACLQDHEVKAFDPNAGTDPYGEMSRRLSYFMPDVVGISLRNIDTCLYQDPFVYLASLSPTLELIRKEIPKAKIFIGGAGFSIYAADVMKRFPSIDFGLLLEAEESFPAVLKDLDHPEQVPGIYFRSNGHIRLSSPPKLPDFDALPSPKWDVVDLEPYKGNLDTFGVQAKRGCGLKCAYCTYYYLNGSHYRLRSPEKLVSEIAKVIKDHRIDHFIFVDSIFNIPPAHAEAICRELIRQKVSVPWTAWYNERVFDLDFFRLAKEAGCRYYSFSPDAYSDRSLKLLHKNLKVEDIKRVYHLALTEKDVYFGFNFFVNPPGQTYFDFIRLMLFYIRARVSLRGRLYGFGLSNIRIEPNSEMFEIAKRDGVVNPDVDLLAETSEELRQRFYTNPKTPLIDFLFKIYALSTRIKHNFSK